MIVEELYDALIEAGASEAKARAASRAIADMEGQFTQIRSDISRLDQRISELQSYVDQRFTQVDGTLRLHNWMLGTILAFLVAVFFKVFSH
jgi:hypothetical protein